MINWPSAAPIQEFAAPSRGAWPWDGPIHEGHHGGEPRHHVTPGRALSPTPSHQCHGLKTSVGTGLGALVLVDVPHLDVADRHPGAHWGNEQAHSPRSSSLPCSVTSSPRVNPQVVSTATQRSSGSKTAAGPPSGGPAGGSKGGASGHVDPDQTRGSSTSGKWSSSTGASAQVTADRGASKREASARWTSRASSSSSSEGEAPKRVASTRRKPWTSSSSSSSSAQGGSHHAADVLVPQAWTQSSFEGKPRLTDDVPSTSRWHSGSSLTQILIPSQSLSLSDMLLQLDDVRKRLEAVDAVSWQKRRRRSVRRPPPEALEVLLWTEICPRGTCLRPASRRRN